MKLYKISQTARVDYDTFDSAVVAAESEEEARNTHPETIWEIPDLKSEDIDWGYKYGTWAPSPDDVKVEYLGEAKEGTKSGVIVASFNAG